MDDKKVEAYEPPTITDIASVHELTLNKKKRRHHAPDGFYRATKVKVS